MTNPHVCVRALISAALLSATALAQSTFNGFAPNNLVVSRSVYTGTAATVTLGQPLPPNCPSTAACGTGVAVANGSYPGVWANDVPDGSFGVTSPVFLDQLLPTGAVVSTLAIPTTLVNTSFSSKSELAVNLSTDGTVLTFMAYQAPANTLDASNSNTPGEYDPTNPVGSSYYRGVVQVDAKGNVQATPTNAYSGNNGRAAILANGLYYMVGNDNNGSGTPTNIVTSTGAEIATPGQPGTTVPQQIGTFSVSQYTNPATGTPYPADKLGKDNNFRGLTIFNNTMYVSKGSGSNGFNTVYQVGAAGTLPTLATAATAPITVLPGFPIVSAKATTGVTYPFGLWFANANTLYVGDEGDGTMATAASNPNSGLQKWVLTNGVWNRVYVLQNGLGLGVSYGITNYPTNLNPVTGGLRNITGRVNADGTVTVWGVTSTVSANGDQGADPNRLVVINDILANTDPGVAGGEQFQLVKSAAFGEVLRGVSLTPGTTPLSPPSLAVVSSASPVGAIAPGSLATVYGANISTATGPRIPLPFLPTTLGGTTITLVDSTGASFSTLLLSATATQAVFLVPSGAATGPATVTVNTNSGTALKATVQINAVAPGLFALNSAGLAAADILTTSASNGLQNPTPSVYGLNSDGSISANPINVSSGKVSLALFGTGIRGGSPVTATVNGTTAPVSYAGPQLDYPGLDQVNIGLPASLAGSGNVAIQVTVKGVAANMVNVVIQ